MNTHNISPIGTVNSPFKQKFGIPRQPGLTKVSSKIKLTGEANCVLAIKDIEQHSHIWVLFLFHENLSKGWKPSVRPPRLGGNKSTGVFATRSSFRPNGIGMSAVKLISTEYINCHWYLNVEGLDLIDGTPVVDIKPYIPYSDSVPDATSDLAPEKPELMEVVFNDDAQTELQTYSQEYPELETVIIEVLQQDPRPAYKKNSIDNKTYAMQLFNLDIKWLVTNNIVTVAEIVKHGEQQ